MPLVPHTATEIHTPFYADQMSIEFGDFSALLEVAQKTMPAHGIAVIANVQSKCGGRPNLAQAGTKSPEKIVEEFL